MEKEKPPFEGPYTKKPAATKDKSGAVHSPMSRARHLARIALQQKQKKTQKVAEEVESVAEGSEQYYAIVHKVNKKPLSTHRDLESAKDEWRGLDQNQRQFYKVVTTKKAPKDWSMKSEGVAEGAKGYNPGWMLKADPKLGAAVKAKQDLNKKRQAAYGNPSAGKSADAVNRMTKEEVEQVNELKDKTVKSYAHKAIADTMQGKKDRNPGIKRAFNQLAGLKEPLMKAKNAMKEGAYSEKEIEDAEMAKNPGMRSPRKPAPKPAPTKPVKENIISNFLNSFKRSSTMLGKKEASPKEEPKKDSKMSFSGFSRSSSMKM